MAAERGNGPICRPVAATRLHDGGALRTSPSARRRRFVRCAGRWVRALAHDCAPEPTRPRTQTATRGSARARRLTAVRTSTLLRGCRAVPASLTRDGPDRAEAQRPNRRAERQRAPVRQVAGPRSPSAPYVGMLARSSGCAICSAHRSPIGSPSSGPLAGHAVLREPATSSISPVKSTNPGWHADNHRHAASTSPGRLGRDCRRTEADAGRKRDLDLLDPPQDAAIWRLFPVAFDAPLWDSARVPETANRERKELDGRQG